MEGRPRRVHSACQTYPRYMSSVSLPSGQLVDDRTKEIIALLEWHFFTTHKLCVSPKGMHIIDDTVATVIYMDRVKRRRDRKESTI